MHSRSKKAKENPDRVTAQSLDLTGTSQDLAFELHDNRSRAIQHKKLQQVIDHNSSTTQRFLDIRASSDGRNSSGHAAHGHTIQKFNAEVVQAGCGAWLASLCEALCSCFRSQEDAEEFEDELIEASPSEVEQVKSKQQKVMDMIRSGEYTYSESNTRLLPVIAKNLGSYTPHSVGMMGERTPMATTSDANTSVHIGGMLTCSAAKVVFRDGENGFVHVMSSSVDDLHGKIESAGKSVNDVTEVTWWQTLQNGEFERVDGGKENEIKLTDNMLNLVKATKAELEQLFEEATVKIYFNEFSSLHLTTDDSVFSVP